MTMKLNDSIISEHEHIKIFIGVVNAIFKKLVHGEAVNKEHLEQLLVFIKDYIDKFHHIKEEDILFKHLEKFGMLGDEDLVGELKADHTLGRMLVTSLTEAIDSYNPADKKLATEIAGTLSLFSTGLTHHICREDTVLIPFIEEKLSESQKLSIEKEYSELDEDHVLSQRELAKLDQLVIFYDINVEDWRRC